MLSRGLVAKYIDIFGAVDYIVKNDCCMDTVVCPVADERWNVDS